MPTTSIMYYRASHDFVIRPKAINAIPIVNAIPNVDAIPIVNAIPTATVKGNYYPNVGTVTGQPVTKMASKSAGGESTTTTPTSPFDDDTL
jgi:hypothetical protein